MTGSGNDFVMVDGRSSRPDDWTAAEIRAVCARGTGVGADGLVLLFPGSGPGAVRMIYFNSDGSRAAMCGNAALCSTRLAAHLGLVSAPNVRLETDAGTYESRLAAESGRAELHLDAVETPTDVPGLAITDGERRAGLGVVGVPHLVVLVDDVDALDLESRGRALRFDPALGPEGANVNFISQGGSPAEWRMRTYERGVEAETLACGTGAVAAACAIEGWSLGKLPVAVWTRSGRKLEVKARRLRGGGYADVWLSGEVQFVFRGVLI